jgi:sugar/nucleoside kinase (ribokinase family)
MSKVGLIGRIGRDFGQRFKRDMEKYGIEVSTNTPTAETGGFRLIYDERGDRTLDVLGVSDPITRKNLPEEYMDTSYFLIGPILGEVDLELIQFLRSSSSAKLFLDPQGLVRVIGKDRRIMHSCNKKAFAEIAKLVDFIKPNEPESQTITGWNAPVQALLDLSKMGSAVPIVTLADQGSLLLDQGELFRIPAFPTTAIDPTGAGDAYAGSFISEYARTRDLEEAALFASAAASIMVEQVGPEFAMPMRTVLERKASIRGRLAKEKLG